MYYTRFFIRRSLLSFTSHEERDVRNSAELDSAREILNSTFCVTINSAGSRWDEDSEC